MQGNEDVFIETIVKRNKTSRDKLLILGLVMLYLLIIFVSFLFLQYVMAFLPLILIGGAYGLYYMISNFDREFEYICTNGQLDVDLIIHKRKRKRQISVAAKDMEILAPVSSDDYKANARNTSLKVMNLTTNSSLEKVWFFVASYKGARYLVTFEPNDRILKDLKRNNPSRVRYTMIQG
ncbi:MAG: hypothetical protein EOM03_00495 [Clostridia bacterium]|nr:hypothetical protein [Clostridia bacterium]NLF20220.1 hypothetical protein [Clostridiaceae bacterium]